MSGRTRQASALRFVSSNQFQDFRLKRILRAVNGSGCLSECLLLELFFNRQAKFSEFFDVGPGMKLQFLKFGEDYLRFLKLRWFYGLICLSNFRFRGAFGNRCRLLVSSNVLLAPPRSGNSLRSVLVFMMLLLTDFFGVRDA